MTRIGRLMMGSCQVTDGKLILHLTLEREWFDEIVRSDKNEEYRELKDYWKTRFEGRTYDIVRFRNGYASDAPEMDVEFLGLAEAVKDGAERHPQGLVLDGFEHDGTRLRETRESEANLLKAGLLFLSALAGVSAPYILKVGLAPSWIEWLIRGSGGEAQAWQAMGYICGVLGTRELLRWGAERYQISVLQRLSDWLSLLLVVGMVVLGRGAAS